MIVGPWTERARIESRAFAAGPRVNGAGAPGDGADLTASGERAVFGSLMQRIVRAFWPMAAWMAVVFVMSTDIGAASHTGRFLIPVLRWIDPDISAQGIQVAIMAVRKSAHFFEYAVLSILILRAFSIARAVPMERWSWTTASLALIGSVAYAASDEIHQLFVASRGPSVHDVLIDSTGAAAGLALVFLWQRARSPKAGPAFGAPAGAAEP